MAMIVKFQCDDGEIFRRPLEQEPSFEAITEVVAACRPEVKAGVTEGSLTYVDDEGDLCLLTPETFADFLDLHTAHDKILRFKLKLPLGNQKVKGKQMKKSCPSQDPDNVAHRDHEPEASLPTPEMEEPNLVRKESKGKAPGKGKKAKEMCKSEEKPVEEPAAALANNQPEVPLPTPEKEEPNHTRKGKAAGKGKKAKEMCKSEEKTVEEPAATFANHQPAVPAAVPTDTCPKEDGPGVVGRLLCSLRKLRDEGMLTPTMFASLAVPWLPFLTQRAAAKLDEINQMAAKGLDQTAQKMLEIIQEEVAATPGLKGLSGQISKALRGEKGGRHLGEVMLKTLRSLMKLNLEVQIRFCESIAAALLPNLEDLSSWPTEVEGKHTVTMTPVDSVDQKV